ncbi:uncharacterized protein OCT59_020705 [Rhizophagus irregularis]|uniref:uncharacterized protein n=1 Tax=Rhizophagus irregularis TaxID=588596 RepID=UPI0033179526|nr:hypothetical protein OCT59_020705 [Rhizophagus irregularis]
MDENAKRDARVEELELKNTELEARLLMLEQGSSVVDGQSQNDRETIAKISAVDESDSVIDQQNDVNTKSMEEVPEVIAEQSVPDKVIDDFILEESVNVPDSVIAQPKQCIPPPIHEVYSQLNLSEVRDPGLCNQNGLTLTPQIEEDSVIPLNEKDGQDVYLASPSSESCVASPGFEYSKEGKFPINKNKQIPVDSDLAPGSIPHLAHLFDKAEKTGRKEKLRWYYYSEEFEKKAITIALENNISDQMARTQIYNEMEPYLPGKKRENLRKVTQKAKNIYTLFKEIGIDKIGLVTYSVDAIGSLTGAQIQNIINLYTAECQKVISVKNSSRSRDLPAESNKSGLKKSPDVGKSTPPTSQTSKTNQTNVRVQSKPTYDRAYFRNKILDQYPNLYKECSCENFDYYGITDETSCGDYICPLCKLGHDDEEIEGEYKAGSYFIKCEQREIEITA